MRRDRNAFRTRAARTNRSERLISLKRPKQEDEDHGSRPYFFIAASIRSTGIA
jgi:hypothetical protein